MANIATIALVLLRLLLLSAITCNVEGSKDNKPGYLKAILDKFINSIIKINKNDGYYSDPRVQLEPHQLIEYYGYKGEKHTIETSDGYILTLHRVVGNKNNQNDKKKPSVILQHGFELSSMDFIVTGPDRGLAFILADSGFDVWLPNARGNKYSRAHKNLTTDDDKFWDFSWHESGVYDLSAVIDYILKTTGNEKVTFVGYSQGTTLSYVLLSELPEYNKKISALFLLGPVGYTTNTHAFLRYSAKFVNIVEKIFDYFRYRELRPFNDDMKQMVYRYCSENSILLPLCKRIFLFWVGGTNEEQFDAELYPAILQHTQLGTSVKHFLHTQKNTKSGCFCKFDYGPEENKKRYGSETPPDYNISNINVPTTMFYSDNDLLTHPKDIELLYNKLPNKNGLIKVENFSHFDFVWGKNVKSLLYDKLLSMIMKYK